jgi:Cys-tRNA(Pro)/Cys-tRNA(Cys) deacylase
VKKQKTNAARLLDKAQVPYEIVAYEVDEDDLSAPHLAEQLHQDVNRIFKTLVLRGDKSGYFVCLVPGGAEVDLKKAAKVSGNKSCALIPMKDLLPLTGYMRGGCSPLGMKKAFPTFIHHSARDFSSIYVSAGLRGLQLLLAPGDLIAATRALAADLIMAPHGNRP